jgi:hypothetical protein
MANANKKSQHQYNYLQDDESIDSFAKPSNRAIETSGPEIISDFNMNEFMNPQANRRRI